MKTFDDLIAEVHKPGLCHRCGGCVSFCSAINYGAITMREDSPPTYKDESKCIECGLCYMICPVTGELLEPTRKRLQWTEPMGHVEQIYIARAKSPIIRELATDGGVVTALLYHLKKTHRIDSAIVSRQSGPLQRRPALASTEREILLSAGSSYDQSPGMASFGEVYSSYSSSVANLAQLKENNLSRVAFVGVPDQILSMRKMESLNVVPSHQIKYYFGLFCSRNFQFGTAERAKLEAMGGFSWDQVDKINLKEKLQIQLKNEERIELPLDNLSFMTRPSCAYCTDYSAEYADISFGGLGAPEGWTVVVTRTPVGVELYKEARRKVLEEMDLADMRPLRDSARELISRYSEAKRANGREQRASLGRRVPVQPQIQHFA